MTVGPLLAEVALHPELHAGVMHDGGAERAERAVAEALEGVRKSFGLDDGDGCAVHLTAAPAGGGRTFALRLGGVEVRYPGWWERRPWLFAGVAGLACHAPTGPLRDLIAGSEHRAAVGAVLRLGLPAGSRSDRLGASLAAGALGADELARTERLIHELAPGRWQILANPHYLQFLADTDCGADAPFPATRTDFAERFKVRLPRLSLREEPSLPERGFAIFSGARCTPPIIGLAPSEVLVTETEVGAAGVAAIQPFTGEPARVVEASGRPDGVSAIEFIARTVSAAAAEQIDALVTTTASEADLAELADVFPLLVEAARSQVPLELLTWLRRRLATEFVGSIDLRRLILTLLDELAVHDALPPPPELLRLVRQRSRSQLTAYAAGGSAELRILRVAAGDEDWEAVSARIAAADPKSLAVVVAPEDRERALARLADEWPGLPVLAADEFAPEADVRPEAA